MPIPNSNDPSIYEPRFVKELFDNMSLTYERMNTITSFGFSNRWRRQCVHELDIQPGQTVVDLMSGMGETWSYICKRMGPTGLLIGVDFSEGMLRYAEQKRHRRLFAPYTISIQKQNVLAGTISEQSADHVIVSFGLKTFNKEQIGQLATQIQRILKPGGQFSCIEVSVPKPAVLRALYLFYLRRIIPILGALFLGNPQTYRMLGIYCSQFRSTQQVVQLFREAGLTCQPTGYFFGCASGIVGKNQVENSKKAWPK